MEQPQLTDSKIIFSGRFLKIREDTVEFSDGKQLKHEILEHPEVVAVVAIKNDKLLLEKQFRAAIAKELWEIPAGGIEPGEKPLAAAQRELQEETGYIADVWKYLTSFYTSPGFTNEIIHLFWADGLKAGPSHPEEDEMIEVHFLELPVVMEMISSGEIQDAKTMLSLQYCLLAKIVGLAQTKDLSLK